MVTQRGLEVLRVIVHDYVANREPVGSKSIVDRYQFGVSAATIRNDMAQLEEEELIVAPHTSSGRIPTDKGYRLFVDHLAEIRPLSPAQRQAIETFLGASPDVDEVLARTVRLLSQLTNQVAMVQYPSLSTARIRHVELVALTPERVLIVVITDTGHVEQRIVEVSADIDESFFIQARDRINEAVSGYRLDDAVSRLESVQLSTERALAEYDNAWRNIREAVSGQIMANRVEKLVIAGAANLVRTEADFSGSVLPILEAVEEQVVLLRLFSELEADERGIAVSIGRENEPFGLAETSVLTSGYNSTGGARAQLGVLGPTRMDYSTNMAAVRAVARYLSHNLGDV